MITQNLELSPTRKLGHMDCEQTNIFTTPDQKFSRSQKMLFTSPYSLQPKDWAISNLTEKDSTPHTQHSLFNSPQRDLYSDRFIPMRHNSISRNLFQLNCCDKINNQIANKGQETQKSNQQEESEQNYKALLMKELLPYSSPIKKNQQNINQFDNQDQLFKQNSQSILKFRSPINSKNSKSMLSISPFRSAAERECDFSFNDFSNQTYGLNNQNYQQKKYKIASIPYKVLDAPGLKDDFYVDLLDWNCNNFISVGLGQCVYLYDASHQKVSKLAEQSTSTINYSSIKWNPNGILVALGNKAGDIELWDVGKQKIVRQFTQQSQRVGCLTWNNQNVFASGSKDKAIIVHDLRNKEFCQRWYGHQQEICGLEWSNDGNHIISGGNDNKAIVWSLCKGSYLMKMKDHKAAIRAVAWNPHQNGVVLTGGGSKDQTIKVWNILTQTLMHTIQVNSQVCKLKFSLNTNEFVSTHGFEDNEIIVWNFQDLKKKAVLQGHTSRVLFLAGSPDNQAIVTGAGDETLKFWKIFPPKTVVESSSLLNKQLDLRQLIQFFR